MAAFAARLAQSVERETLNLKVVGSTPTSGSIPDVPSRTTSYFFGIFCFHAWACLFDPDFFLVFVVCCGDSDFAQWALRSV